MVRCLRASRGQTGLVLANGGTLTYQHVVCLASKAPSFEYPAANPLPEHLDDKFATPADEITVGEAYIEVRLVLFSDGLLTARQTYSVQFNRDGTPDIGLIVCRFARNGGRALANHADARTLVELADMATEQVGKRGWIVRDTEDDQRNLFSFSSPADTKL
jgi:Thiolase-like protein type 1 additional C-terminal domain